MNNRELPLPIHKEEDFARFVEEDLRYIFRYVFGPTVRLFFHGGHLHICIEANIDAKLPCDLDIGLDFLLDFESNLAYATAYACFHDDPEEPVTDSQRKDIVATLRGILRNPKSLFIVEDHEQSNTLGTYKGNPMGIGRDYGWSVSFPRDVMELVRNIRIPTS